MGDWNQEHHPPALFPQLYPLFPVPGEGSACDQTLQQPNPGCGQTPERSLPFLIFWPGAMAPPLVADASPSAGTGSLGEERRPWVPPGE